MSPINKSVPRDRLLDSVIGQDAIQRRLNQLQDENIRPLTEWVIARRSDPRIPLGAGATIPWMDPDSGGTRSRVLLLLQDPSRTAATGTGFISPDNNDPTARNTTESCNNAGLARISRLHWNVYPWWVNTKKDGSAQDPSRPVETWSTATRIAADLWGEFFQLLPELRVIVTLGVQASRGWQAAIAAGLQVPDGVQMIDAPSLSPPGYYSNKQEIWKKLSVARTIAK